MPMCHLLPLSRASHVRARLTFCFERLPSCLQRRAIGRFERFPVHTQAILEVIEIFVQFHPSSLYRNDRGLRRSHTESV